jgi:hypothetical protein
MNTLFWGFALWLFGYILEIVFFAFVPKERIGWFVLPIGLIATLLVLFKKIERESFKCFIGLGVIWTVIAVVFDYVFIVRLFNSTDYYKPDVYLYYTLTFLLPITVGWYRLKNAKRV